MNSTFAKALRHVPTLPFCFLFWPRTYWRPVCRAALVSSVLAAVVYAQAVALQKDLQAQDQVTLNTYRLTRLEEDLKEIRRNQEDMRDKIVTVRSEIGENREQMVESFASVNTQLSAFRWIGGVLGSGLIAATIAFWWDIRRRNGNRSS